jgi:hypothetical protein
MAKPFEMAAIFGGELGNERRSPHRAKAVAVAHRGKAPEQRVHEDWAAIRAEAHIVNVAITGDPRGVRSEERVIGVGGCLTGGKNVVEALERRAFNLTHTLLF